MNEELARLRAENAQLREALAIAEPIVCVATCPTVKEPNAEWTHSANCTQISATLKASGG